MGVGWPNNAHIVAGQDLAEGAFSQEAGHVKPRSVDIIASPPFLGDNYTQGRTMPSCPSAAGPALPKLLSADEAFTRAELLSLREARPGALSKGTRCPWGQNGVQRASVQTSLRHFQECSQRGTASSAPHCAEAWKPPPQLQVLGVRRMRSAGPPGAAWGVGEADGLEGPAPDTGSSSHGAHFA